MPMRDIDIRYVLYNELNLKFGSDPDTIIIDELGLCQGDARIDVAVVNGSLHGYEIKSEQDTLDRLPKQMEYYNKVFDIITIISGRKHIEKIEELVPSWWGIAQAIKRDDGLVQLSLIREPQLNTHVDPYAIAQLLWRDEVFCILKERGLHKGLSSKPRRILWKTMAEKMTLSEIQLCVREQLKARKNWRADQRQR